MPKWTEIAIASLDTETTGLDPARARVIEIGVVCYKSGNMEDSYSQLIDPGEAIPPEITKITGISAKDLAGKPRFKDAIPRLLECLKGRVFVAYNASYDIGMLKAEFARVNMPFPELQVVDPLVLARGVLRLKSYKLGMVASHLGVDMERAHRAQDDADAAVRILYKLADRLPQDLDELLGLQEQWKNEQDALRRRWKNKTNDTPPTKKPGMITDVLNTNTGTDAGLRLGPAYMYSKDTHPDPIIAFIKDYASRHAKKD